MQAISNLLRFLRLTDPDGTLSLTSVALIAVLYKFMSCPMETEALVALLGAMSFYTGKKYLGSKAVKAEVETTVKELSALVTDLSKRTTVVENRTSPGVRR